MNLFEQFDRIKIFQETIKKANDAYRTGDPLDISQLDPVIQNFLNTYSGELKDPQYDSLLDELRKIDPTNEIFENGVIENTDIINSERKVPLAKPMYSLDKETSVEDIQKWGKNKGLKPDTEIVLTPKFDGASALKEELTGKTASRGDGVTGQDITEHVKNINPEFRSKKSTVSFYSIGELIMPKKVFEDNKSLFKRDDGRPYKNQRNMVAGLINKDEVSPYWKYIDHIRYGVADEDCNLSKEEQLELIANETGYECPYEIMLLSDITSEKLDELYYTWGEKYEIDGLVLDVNDKNLRKSLGRETNNNPAYARAYKANWTPPVATPVIKNVYDVSKEGYVKPVVNVMPFNTEGVTISRATGYNARFILNNKIGEGAIVEIIRSGSVIPKIVRVVKPSEHPDNLPENCPCCGSVLEWNKNGVELVCNNPKCSTKNIKKIAFFFETLGVENFGEQIVAKFYFNGYDTINKILQMVEKDISTMDGMGTSSANKFLVQIEEKVKKSSFEKLAHASGCFENLGSRKIKMIIDGLGGLDAYDEFKSRYLSFCDYTTQKMVNELNKINGVSDITAMNFLNGINAFEDFLNETGLTFKRHRVSGSSLKGRSFVFTGVRDETLENYIMENGGEVKGSVSKNTTDVIVKDLNSTSSKITKARELGINIVQIDNFRSQIGK